MIFRSLVWEIVSCVGNYGISIEHTHTYIQLISSGARRDGTGVRTGSKIGSIGWIMKHLPAKLLKKFLSGHHFHWRRLADNCDTLDPFPGGRLLWQWNTKTYATIWQVLPIRWLLMLIINWNIAVSFATKYCVLFCFMGRGKLTFQIIQYKYDTSDFCIYIILLFGFIIFNS